MARKHRGGQRQRSDKQRVRSTLAGIFRGGVHPAVAQMVRQTPSTGHASGDARRMVREVENWPEHWAPARLRRKLANAIKKDPQRTYVYYPIGSHRPNVQHRRTRYSLEEFVENFGRRKRNRGH